MSINNHLIRALDTVGDGTGTTNANGNYAATAEEFFIQPPAGQLFTIHHLMVEIVDTASIDAGKYGTGIILTNGIGITIENGALLVDLTHNLKIKTTAEWAYLAGPNNIQVFNWGAGNDIFIAEIAIANHFGKAITLNGDLSEKLIITLNDDFTGLVNHKFIAHGTKTSI